MISSVKFEERLTDWDAADERRRRATAGSYIPLAADGGRSTLLVSLDLSAAFDTIDHDVLLSRLNHLWIKTYLSDSSHFVRIGSHTSQLLPVISGCPKAPCLDRSFFLFTLLRYPQFLGSITFSSNSTQTILNYTVFQKKVHPFCFHYN